MASFISVYIIYDPNERSHGRLNEHVAVGTNYVYTHPLSSSHTYALSVWRPPISKDSLCQLNHCRMGQYVWSVVYGSTIMCLSVG